MTRRMVLGLWLALASAACGDDGMSEAMSGPGAGASSVAAGVKACNDVADAIDAACVRCGETPGACRAAFMSARSCSAAVGVRDTSALYGVCLPRLSGISCSALQTDPVASLDPTCKGQILFTP